VKRSPLRRKTPLRARAPMRRARAADARRLNGPLDERRLCGEIRASIDAQLELAPKPRSKYKSRPRHTAYMLWVKRQPCLMRGVWGRCEGRVEADHAGRRGAGRKAHDSTCIPLCKLHHQASRFPLAWTQDQRRAWLHAAVVYTQAVARAADVEVPVDPEPATEYPTIAVDLAWVVLAEAAASAARALTARAAFPKE